MRAFLARVGFFNLAWIVALIGVTFAVTIAWKSLEWIHHNEHMRFDSGAEEVVELITKRLDANAQLLYSTAAFFQASEHITQSEWEIFAKGFKWDKRFSSFRILGYAINIPSHNLMLHEQSMHEEGLLEYKVYPYYKESLYTLPIIYLAPFDNISRKALGFDISSETVRRQTIFSAIERKEVTLSPKVELMIDDVERNGFNLYLPLFKATHSQEPLLINRIEGVVFASIKADLLFENFRDTKYLRVDFEVYDGVNGNDKIKLFDSNPTLHDTRLTQEKHISCYGRVWTIRFKANEMLDIGWSRYLPFVELILGVFLALACGRWLASLQRTRKEAFQIAQEKTEQLSYSEAQMRSVFQAMHDGILVQNNEGIFTDCNASAERILGLSATEIIGGDLYDERWQAILENGRVLEVHERPSYRALHTKQPQYNVIMGIKRTIDHTIVWVLSNAEPILSEDGNTVLSVVITLSDITHYRKSNQQLQDYIEIIDTHVIISTTDREGIITEVSEAFCKISGHSKEELIGKSHSIVRHPDMPSLVYQQMWEQIKQGKSWHGEMLNRRKDGSAYWVETIIAPRFDESGSIIGYTAIRQDITDKKRVEEVSITDRLTGLYNRLKLDELFAFHLSMARRHQSDFSIILVDIDHFKNVNDEFGHQVGDILLQEIAHCLKHKTRLEDAVGRWGGEEFLLLLPSSALSSALHLAEKLRHCIEHMPFTTAGKVTASFGVTCFEPNDDDTSMLKRADEALYLAKKNGRNRVEALSSHS